MLSLYQLKNSDDLDIVVGFQMDKIGLDIMKQLNIKPMRASKILDDKIARKQDFKKFRNKYAKKINLKGYSIHHTFSGLLVLVPTELHNASHKGYRFRLAN